MEIGVTLGRTHTLLTDQVLVFLICMYVGSFKLYLELSNLIQLVILGIRYGVSFVNEPFKTLSQWQFSSSLASILHSNLWNLKFNVFLFDVFKLANQFVPNMGESTVLTVACIFLSSLIVAANFTVCVLVCFRKNLRTYTNGFVVSLAFSDILIGSVLIPASLIFEDSSVVLGYLVSITLLSGVFNLASVTFDRCIAVMKALQYESFMRINFSRMIWSSWLAALVISLVPLLWGTDTTELKHKVFVITELALCVFLPYMFIFAAYLKIFQQVKRSLEREREITASVRKTMQRKGSVSSEAKLAQVFIIVALMFVLSWLPIHYMTIAHEIGRIDLIPHSLRIVSLFTVALGSLINPIIYSFPKPDFRKSIRLIFCRRKKRRSGKNETWTRGGSSHLSTATSSLKMRLTSTNTKSGITTRVW